MTDERMALIELIEKQADTDLVREMLAQEQQGYLPVAASGSFRFRAPRSRGQWRIRMAAKARTHDIWQVLDAASCCGEGSTPVPFPPGTHIDQSANDPTPLVRSHHSRPAVTRGRRRLPQVPSSHRT